VILTLISPAGKTKQAGTSIPGCDGGELAAIGDGLGERHPCPDTSCGHAVLRPGGRRPLCVPSCPRLGWLRCRGSAGTLGPGMGTLPGLGEAVGAAGRAAARSPSCGTAARRGWGSWQSSGGAVGGTCTPPLLPAQPYPSPARVFGKLPPL